MIQSSELLAIYQCIIYCVSTRNAQLTTRTRAPTDEHLIFVLHFAKKTFESLEPSCDTLTSQRQTKTQPITLHSTFRFQFLTLHRKRLFSHPKHLYFLEKDLDRSQQKSTLPQVSVLPSCVTLKRTLEFLSSSSFPLTSRPFAFYSVLEAVPTQLFRF